MMDARRLSTFRAVAETLVPPGARLERVMQYAERAIDELSPGRRAEFDQLMDVLTLPMKMNPVSRAGVLRAMADAPVAKLRTGFATLKRLLLFCAYAESEPGDPNPLWAHLQYPGPRSDRGTVFPLLPYRVAQSNEIVRADVIVIGSGAGGGVAASSFARAGKNVVVLEAGPPLDSRVVDQREMSMRDLYLDSGLTSTEDLGVAILAGSVVGGGTAVNWCTSLRMPARIANEWATESGIGDLPAQLAPHYDAIERELGLAPAARHNPNNQVIVNGAQALGIHSAAMPRNASTECSDGCGYCGFGCAYGNKRGTAHSFLPDVAENGGAIYARAKALAIRVDGRRANGVIVEQTTPNGEVRRFDVHADLIVVAAGTLRSPGLLARSGIKSGALGQRLHLHPVSAVITEFDCDIRPFEGPMQSAYSDAYNYRMGNYGAKIEAAPTHPGIAAIAIPWAGRSRHAAAMAATRRSATLIAVVRDRDPGSIDLDDEMAIRYRVSNYDGENLLEGILGMMDLAFAAGAERAMTLHNAPIAIERSAWTSARRAALGDKLRSIGTAPNRQIFFSAHQMGTCAMGSQESTSVVDPSGRVWGYDNLIVADASVFPQASGVNPMLTIMAMASRIAAEHGGSLERGASHTDPGEAAIAQR